MNITNLFNLKTLVVSLALAVLGVLGVSTAVHALPQDCDNNSIVYCGYQNLGEFKNKYQSSGELQTFYNYAHNQSVASSGLHPSEINRYVAEGKFGYVYRNGDVILDNGQKVMTNAWSIGRQPRNDPRRVPIKIGDVTYYKSIVEVGFASTTQKIPVFVLFNDDGEVEFATMNSCANTVWGNNVKPKYSCDKLNSERLSDKSFKFTTNATADASTNANIVKVIYDLGDGNKVEKTNKDQKFEYTHTYAKAGNYNVKVEVVVSLPGGKTKTVSGTYCVTQVEAKEQPKPEFSCKALDRYLIEGNRKYKFVATGTHKNAELVSATFDFGDGQKAENITKKVVVSPTESTITVEHQYAKEKTGKLTATVDLKFKVGNDFKNSKCTIPVELTELTCKDTPEKPECKPPKECKPGIPEDDDRCKEILPKEIVKTGPAEIAAGALGLGSLAGAGMYYRASRRNLLDKIFKR